MKKLLLYLMAAVILGVLTVTVPLMTIASLTRQELHLQESNFLGGLSRLEGNQGLGTSGSYVYGFIVLIVSFVMALTVHIFVRRRMPSRGNDEIRVPTQ